MPWPGLTDFSEAVQNPAVCFKGTELESGEVALNRRGLPLVFSGSFACVYSLSVGDHKFAVRCFTREIKDQQSRYEQLSNYLHGVLPPAFVSFEYLEHGINFRGDWYPIVKMDWVEGDPLGKFVDSNINEPDTLRRIAAQWRGGTTANLRGLRIAHNDLQHGNVMVQRDGSIRLVDYDGMFLPHFRGERSPELGHKNYQHPLRTSEDYDDYVDNFPTLVIYTSLLAVAAEPELWSFFNDDNLIFTRDDYADPKSSQIFSRLKDSPDPAVINLTKWLEDCCSLAVKEVPDLETILQNLPPGPAPARSPSAPAPGTTPPAPGPAPSPTPVEGLPPPGPVPTPPEPKHKIKKLLLSLAAIIVGILVVVVGLIAVERIPGMGPPAAPATPEPLEEEALTSEPTAAVAAAAVLEVDSATLDGTALTLTYNETLDDGVTLTATAFSVSVNGESRSVSSVSVSGSAVTLTLASAVSAGDTVTMSYTRPSGPDVIRDTQGRSADSFSALTVTNNTASDREDNSGSTGSGSRSQTENNLATGAPVITGTPRVGETLTASSTGIKDSDGLTNATFTYQWLADDADISGATGSTYILVDADQGKTVTVRVTFTDDLGNEESLTSAATAEVKPQLTAATQSVPSAHEGQNTTFTFQLRFSEEPHDGFSYETMRADAFTVTGGSVTGARRLDAPSNIGWEIRVAPTGNGDVVIVLPPTTNCNAQGAVCTDDGRMLSERVEITVPGPSTDATLSGLTLSGVTLSPAFGPDTHSYSAEVGSEVTTVTVSPTANHGGATYVIRLNGALDADGRVSLGTGASVIAVVVTAGDGATRQTYTVTVTRAASPLTAAASGAPTSHDGSAAFTFQLRFSEEPRDGFSYETMRDDAFTVTGGSVTGARRLVKGSNIGWEIRVAPTGNGDIVIVLPPTTDCNSDGAICTGDGRMLSSQLDVTVPGP